MDLFEIRLNVAARLDNDDLTCCVRVCRLWHETFVPFLYKTVRSTSWKHWPSFSKTLHHIRDLEIHLSTTDSELDRFAQYCHHIRRVRLSPDSFPNADNPTSIALVKANPLLEHIELFGTILHVHTSNQILLLDTVLQHCPRVIKLGLFNNPLDSDTWDRIAWDFGTRLTHLELQLDRPLLESLKWIAALESSESMAATTPLLWPELRELRFSSRQDVFAWEDQLQLFKLAPKLEYLSWLLIQPRNSPYPIKTFVETLCTLLQGKNNTVDTTGSSSSADDNGVSSRQQSSTWPRLDSLELGEKFAREQSSSFHDIFLCQILTTCPNPLRRLKLPRATLGPKSWKVLRQRHRHSLKILEVAPPSWMTQEILSSFPNLREYYGHRLQAYDLIQGYGAENLRTLAVEEEITASLRIIGMRERLQALGVQRNKVTTTDSEFEDRWADAGQGPRPWCCVRLQVLRVCLEKMAQDKANDQVFEQLTRLKELRELHLTVGTTKYGLDPEVCLNKVARQTPSWRSSSEIVGQYKTAQRIRSVPVGRQLLGIWPGLENCFWQCA